MREPQRFSSSAGIAIGPILFVIALLAVLAAVMSAGNGDYQTASGADRITADIGAQANLIRNTINDCNLQYTLVVSTEPSVTSAISYPASNTSTGTAVSALLCDPLGSSSLWGAILLPPPTGGFNSWMYIDASASNGGRCIWTSPSTSNPVNNPQVTSGLTRVASKFNSSTSYSSTSEVIYDPASTSQKFIVWITLPTGSANSNCLP